MILLLKNMRHNITKLTLGILETRLLRSIFAFSGKDDFSRLIMGNFDTVDFFLFSSASEGISISASFTLFKADLETIVGSASIPRSIITRYLAYFSMASSYCCLKPFKIFV